MKRIGTTDNGVLLEVNTEDVFRIMTACDALQSVFELVAGKPVPAPEPIPVKKEVRTGSAKRAATKPARTPSDGAMAREVIDGTAKGKRPCEMCGTPFTPKTDRSRFCGKACIDKDYRAKHATNTEDGAKLKCLGCGKAFEKKRSDQTCCSKECRKTYCNRSRSSQVKPAPAPVVQVVTPAVDRLAAIRAADRRAREARGEIDPLERAARIASGIRAEDTM